MYKTYFFYINHILDRQTWNVPLIVFIRCGQLQTLERYSNIDWVGGGGGYNLKFSNTASSPLRYNILKVLERENCPWIKSSLRPLHMNDGTKHPNVLQRLFKLIVILYTFIVQF